MKNYLILAAILSTLFCGNLGKNVRNLKFKLRSGDSMPMVGFGTYQIEGTDLIYSVLDWALGAGYRLIDTAKIYKNEEDMGKSLKTLLPKYNLTRQDVFITTKLSPTDHGELAYEALKESVRKLDTGYVDLYLIHWPGSYQIGEDQRPVPAKTANHSSLRDESWKQLTKGLKEGLTRNLGVSNYLVKHLQELLANDHGVKPAVNQVEWHPHNHREDLLDFCKKEGILVQAYSSLGGTDNPDLLKDPKVQEIATKLGKSPAQVLLKWPLQDNIAIIPKARSKGRIEENIDLDFEIPVEDVRVLDGFDKHVYDEDPEIID